MLREVGPDRLCAPLGETLVVFIATNAIGIAFDSQRQRRIGEHDAADLGQLLARHRAKCVLAGVEENVGHVDDQAARRVASLEDSVELLQQAGAEFFAITLGLLEFLFGCCSGICGGSAITLRFSIGALLLLESRGLGFALLALGLVTCAQLPRRCLLRR